MALLLLESRLKIDDTQPRMAKTQRKALLPSNLNGLFKEIS